jgi:flagellar hook-length control protein FliK
VAVPAAADEVLSVDELLQLLEQGAGFAQALAAVGASAAPQAAAGAGAAAAEPAALLRRKEAGRDGDDDAPCDIVTLIRLLESPPQPAAAAAATAVAAAADDAPVGDEHGFGEADRPALSGHGLARTAAALPLAVGAAAAGPAADHGASQSALDATSALTPLAAAAAPVAGREGSTLRLPDAAGASADPAQATLSFVQHFKSDVPTSAPPERVIHVPVRDPAWPQAVAAEIRFLTDQKIEAATLRLSPEHLGPVEVRIDVHDNNVSVSFGVTHGDTQAALEQALPRLREMFAAAGLNLGQASVQQEARRGSQHGSSAAAAGAGAANERDGGASGAVRAVGLVDEYV